MGKEAVAPPPASCILAPTPLALYGAETQPRVIMQASKRAPKATDNKRHKPKQKHGTVNNNKK